MSSGFFLFHATTIAKYFFKRVKISRMNFMSKTTFDDIKNLALPFELNCFSILEALYQTFR